MATLTSNVVVLEEEIPVPNVGTVLVAMALEGSDCAFVASATAKIAPVDVSEPFRRRQQAYLWWLLSCCINVNVHNVSGIDCIEREMRIIVMNTIEWMRIVVMIIILMITIV